MLKEIIYAIIGTLGFGILFNANKNKYVYIMLCGMVNYIGYYLVYKYTNSCFLASLVSSLLTHVYSSIMSFYLKCPSTIFMVTGLIVIVPGSSLFYMMQNFVLANYNEAIIHLLVAIKVILGIVSGILISSAIITFINKISKKVKYMVR